MIIFQASIYSFEYIKDPKIFPPGNDTIYFYLDRKLKLTT